MKKLIIGIVSFAMLWGGFAFADFVTNQKLDLITQMAGVSEDIVRIAAECKKITDAQATIGIAEGDITGGMLVGTAFEGMTWSEISNAFGSIDNLNSTWYSVQGVNLRAVSRVIK